MQRYLSYEISFHARGVRNPFPVKSQKVTRFHERMPVQKHLNFFLFLFCKSDDFLNHFDIAQRPNIVVIRPVRDRGCVADVDIILNIRHVKPTIASGEVYRPEKVFMTFTGLKAQRILSDIRRSDNLQPKVVRSFAMRHAVAYPLMSG
ncbi:hypothetical protein RABR111495_18270 [Rahnella bruchi]